MVQPIQQINRTTNHIQLFSHKRFKAWSNCSIKTKRKPFQTRKGIKSRKWLRRKARVFNPILEQPFGNDAFSSRFQMNPPQSVDGVLTVPLERLLSGRITRVTHFVFLIGASTVKASFSAFHWGGISCAYSCSLADEFLQKSALPQHPD